MPRVSDQQLTLRLSWLLLVSVMLLLGLALKQTLQQIEKLYLSDTLNSAARLSDQFQQIEVFLEAMRGQAEERMRSDPQSTLTRQLYKQLQNGAELNLDKPPVDLPRGLVGNLTGAGPLPPPGSEREARLHLALSLSPLLATASQRLGPEIGWAYFTGVDDFIYLYPWVPSKQFRFTSEIYQKPYWQDALAGVQPKQQSVLSRPYNDFAGLGSMVTLSQPLFKDDKLVGMISIDILQTRLHQLLQQLTPSLGNLSLINQFQQVLASSDSQPFVPSSLTPADKYHWQQGALQLSHSIPDTPLLLVHRIPLINLLWAMLVQSAPTLIAIIFMMLAAFSSLRVHRLNRQLNYLSCHDALTGAFNRHYLATQEQLGTFNSRQQLGVVILDADYFKLVNDCYGHGVGDVVLVKLAQLFQRQLRQQDTLIRWGGEEFLILVSGSNDSLLADIAERLRTTVANHSWATIVPGLSVTISLGYHAYQSDISLQETIRRADLALYQAKAKGRNRSESWQEHSSLLGGEPESLPTHSTSLSVHK
ncbi:sensor domain-containing diguanylate cyclase [Aeromonas cavernicola]|uniref:diguanylate cyclase n=1 Tax=Aeromonas cavernicola TaxID=1006623 RepID=A0A2H9U1K9_9GAMM|nr:sensor domain-containing diguanylate cyclase [Aeromonas cavernicola]PJG57911.1 sensor domain-containing diguanylate cyclase [Aeromonas cavernicola]